MIVSQQKQRCLKLPKPIDQLNYEILKYVLFYKVLIAEHDTCDGCMDGEARFPLPFFCIPSESISLISTTLTANAKEDERKEQGRGTEGGKEGEKERSMQEN